MPAAGTLHEAVHVGDVAEAKRLLAEGADPNAVDDVGRTPLHWAAAFGHTEVAGVLVGHGADLDPRDPEGRTPLHWAAYRGGQKMVSLLAEAGADVSARDEKGRSAVRWAGLSKDEDMILRVLAAGAKADAGDRMGGLVFSAAATGDDELMDRLLGWGAAIDACDLEGRTALGRAAMTGDLDAAESLLDRGADPNAQDCEGLYPLHIAIASGQPEAVALLLARGADINAASHKGRTALHLAVINGRTEIVRFLISKGANPDSKDPEGRTPLDQARDWEPQVRGLEAAGECGPASNAVAASPGLQKARAELVAALRGDGAAESATTSDERPRDTDAGHVQPVPDGAATDREVPVIAGEDDAVAIEQALQSLRATPRGSFEEPAEGERDEVDCTVFAPPEALPADHILVQVFAHMHEQAEAAQEMAQEFDADARRRGVVALATEIARGSRLTFELLMPPLAVQDPVQELIWRGRPNGVQFEVEIPGSMPRPTVVGTVLVSQGSVPIGEVKFKLKVVSEGAEVDRSPAPAEEAHRYEMAFVSYASQDRPEVLRRVQMLTAVGIGFFQDVIHLDPGDRWRQKLFHHIDQSDVMFLFWSSAAKRSKWVRREWRYALKRKGRDFVRPVIIEGPPPVPPPRELADLHFNDKVLYFLEETGTSPVR